MESWNQIPRSVGHQLTPRDCAVSTPSTAAGALIMNFWPTFLPRIAVALETSVVAPPGARLRAKSRGYAVRRIRSRYRYGIRVQHFQPPPGSGENASLKSLKLLSDSCFGSKYLPHFWHFTLFEECSSGVGLLILSWAQFEIKSVIYFNVVDYLYWWCWWGERKNYEIDMGHCGCVHNCTQSLRVVMGTQSNV